jgi:hypothetical protein
MVTRMSETRHRNTGGNNEIECMGFLRLNLSVILNAARHGGKPYIDVESDNLHKQVGGHSNSNHRMPICREVMMRMMRGGDSILKERNETLLIRYVLGLTATAYENRPYKCKDEVTNKRSFHRQPTIKSKIRSSTSKLNRATSIRNSSAVKHVFDSVVSHILRSFFCQARPLFNAQAANKIPMSPRSQPRNVLPVVLLINLKGLIDLISQHAPGA